MQLAAMFTLVLNVAFKLRAWGIEYCSPAFKLNAAPCTAFGRSYCSFHGMRLLMIACREDDGLFLESDTDEQLLLNIHFNQKVRIHSITIKGPEEEGPKVVKLYTNRCAAVGAQQQAHMSAAGAGQATNMLCCAQLQRLVDLHGKAFLALLGSVLYILAVHVAAARIALDGVSPPAGMPCCIKQQPSLKLACSVSAALGRRMSLGFSDADSVPCAQQLDLTPKELAGEPIALKLTKVIHPRVAWCCAVGAPLLQLNPCRLQAVDASAS
jgi:hypothetical protein